MEVLIHLSRGNFYVLPAVTDMTQFLLILGLSSPPGHFYLDLSVLGKPQMERQWVVLMVLGDVYSYLPILQEIFLIPKF